MELIQQQKFLGRFWGSLTVFLSLVFLLRPDVLTELRHLVEENRSFSMMYALVSLLVGLATISIHNQWKLNWTLVITVFGWLSVLKAFMVLCFNEFKVQAIPSFSERLFATQMLLSIVLLFGSWLFYKANTVKDVEL